MLFLAARLHRGKQSLKILYKLRYVIPILVFLTACACVYPAGLAITKIEPAPAPPRDTPAAEALEKDKRSFPPYPTGFIMLFQSTAAKDPVLLDSAEFSRFDFNLEYYSKTGKYLDAEYVRTHLGEDFYFDYEPAPGNKVSLYVSYRSALKKFPLSFARDTLSANNLTARFSIAYNDTGSAHDTKVFYEGLNKTLPILMKIHGLDAKGVKGYILGVPSMKAALATSFVQLVSNTLFMTLPIALAVLGFVLQSGRLLLVFPLLFFPSLIISMALIYPISKVLPPDILVLEILFMEAIGLSLSVTFLWGTRWRTTMIELVLATGKMPRDGACCCKFRGENPDEGLTDDEHLEVMGRVYATSGRTVLITTQAMALCFASLTSLRIEAIQVVGVAGIIVSEVICILSMTVPGALMLAFPNFFFNALILWCGAVQPIGHQSLRTSQAEAAALIAANGGGPQMVAMRESPNAHRRTLDPRATFDLSMRQMARGIAKRWYSIDSMVRFVGRPPQSIFFILVGLAIVAFPFYLGVTPSFHYSSTKLLPTNSDSYHVAEALDRTFGEGQLTPFVVLSTFPGEYFFEESLWKVQQELTQAFIDRTPGTQAKNVNGMVFSGILVGSTKMGPFLTVQDYITCYTEYMKKETTPECQVILVTGSTVINPPRNTSRIFISDLGFNPVSDQGRDWHKSAHLIIKEFLARDDVKKMNMTIEMAGVPTLAFSLVDFAVHNFPYVLLMTYSIVFVVLVLTFGSIVLSLKVVLVSLIGVLGALGATSLVMEYKDQSWHRYFVSFQVVLALTLDVELASITRCVVLMMDGAEPASAMKVGITDTAAEVLACSISLVIAYLSLVVSDVVVVREVGFNTAVGSIAFAFFVHLLISIPLIQSIPSRILWFPMKTLHWMVPKQLELDEELIRDCQQSRVSLRPKVGPGGSIICPFDEVHDVLDGPAYGAMTDTSANKKAT